MKSFLLSCVAFASTALATYDDAQAQISLQLSQDAYCGKDYYL